jgi:glycosyltransferase involved in cell wall biosynthesis
MKVLNIIDIPWHSALAAYALDQGASLAGRGHGVFFAAPEKSAAAAFALANRFPLTIIPHRKDYMLLGALMKLKKLIEDEAIDVVNAHTGKAQTMAWLLSLISSRPFVLIRTKADAKRPSAGVALGRTALVIAGSKAIKEMYLAAGLDPAKIEVVYQGVIPPPEKIKTPSVPLKVGILGRLDPVKGHICFIEAAALVLKKFPGAEFLIAGREEDVKYAGLRARAEALGIAGKVKYAGHVPDAIAFSQSCDVGVIASLASEAVSRAALEWLAAGRPLVATAVGSLPEFLPPEWLVPPRDAAMLAEKLLSLLESPEKMLAAGAANRAKALADFTPAAFAERTENIFKKAAGLAG